jgi:hypothetical protein
VKDLARYDGALQMFCERPQDVNLAHLRFLRWLIERGQWEHAPAGPPSGPFAETPVADELLATAA